MQYNFTQFIFQATAKQGEEPNVSFPLNMERKHLRLARRRGIILFGAQHPIMLMKATKHGKSVMSVRVE